MKQSKKELADQGPGNPGAIKSEIELINRLHREIRGSARITAEKAIELGEKLATLKAKIGHGGWLKYVKENFEFGDRTAQRYMELAENKEALRAKFDSVSDFNLTDAYRVVASQKPARQIQEVLASEQGDDGEYSKGEIITGLTRDLTNRLEWLTCEQLIKFRAAVAEFKENWLKDNIQFPTTYTSTK